MLAGLFSLVTAGAGWSQYDDPPPPDGGSCQNGDIQATVNLTFDPSTHTTQAGQQVKICNNSGLPHNVVSDNGSFPSNSTSTSWTYIFTLNTPGTYPYHCSQHAGMNGTIVVQDSAPPPGAEQHGSLRFSSSAYSVGEAGGNATITVQRVDGDDGAVSAQYATSNGSATAGSDYTAKSGTVSWADNDDSAKSFAIAILNDSADENNETVNLTLTAPTGGATLASPSTAVVTINDDDGPPPPGTTAPAAPSNLVAEAQSTTEIELTWRDNAASTWIAGPSNETAFSIEMRTLLGTFAEVDTAPANATSRTISGLDPGSFYLFRVRAQNGAGNSAFSNESSASTFAAAGPCTPATDALCVNGGRFKIEVDWRSSNDDGIGSAVAVPSAPDSGLFYFFSPSNLEALVKVLNACGLNNRYWVFFAATTNVEFALTVTDTQVGRTKSYFNPLNRAAPPVQDTDAFATCP